MSSMPEPALKHIPAWKKLGLKLKYVKEDADDVSGGRDAVRDSKKRKTSNGDGDFNLTASTTDRPSKKLKEMKTSNGYSPEHLEKKASPPADATNTPSTNTPSTKRKAVSFTPETKEQDGESAKQLYKTWLDRQLAQDPSFDTSTVNPALRSIEPATAASDEFAPNLKSFTPPNPASNPDTSRKRPQKEKAKKKAKPSRIPQPKSPSTDHPALTYLQTYHNSPKTWKFSKPHQNHLLKHLFSPVHIPPSYDTALLSYLRGLQGSARSRVRQQALIIREDDGKWLATEPTEHQKMDQETTAQCLARQKRDFDAAVARVKQRLRDKEDEREDKEWEVLGDKEEWEKRVYKRRRAEIVLWGVGEDEEIVEDTVALSRHAILGNSRPAVGAQVVTIQSRGMGGVRQISNGGVAEGSAGKKTVFGDDGAKQAGAADGVQKVNGVNGVKKSDARAGANGVQAKRKRKRKRRTGVPDDDSSSESSSSSSSEESEEDEKQILKGKVQYQGNGKGVSRKSETSNSDSDSGSVLGTSSSGDSDSD